MLKTRIILLGVSIAAIAGLFLLPRVVIENDQTITGAPADSVAERIEMHAAVPPETEQRIRILRAGYSADSRNEKNAIFADSLAGLYSQAGKFDSSAWFAEEATKFFNNTESRIKAGDSYYQAYSFALDPSRQAYFAGKAQSFYNMVLETSPDNLDVKTKLAMTYLTDASPMKAITMLREVLAEDPQNKTALYNMGMLSIQSGQYDKAIERLEQLVQIDAENTQAHLLLGIAYMNGGSKRKAKEQFEKVKQLDNDPSVQATADSYLKDLK
jgi:outer membrane protein